MYELRHQFPIKGLVKVAGLSRSTYYHLVSKMNQPDPDRKWKRRIQWIYKVNEGRCGYRRITDVLQNKGHTINHKKVLRLMRELGIRSQVRMKKYVSYKGKVGKIADNILNREFKAEKPNQKWVTDITEFRLFGEKLYLSPVLDLFNGEIITYTIGSRPVYSLVSQMLDQAIERLNGEDELLMHSDQGWHYQMKKYRETLKDHNITQSMSRKGNCHDNAVIENFFGIMKSELLYYKEFTSVDHFKQELEKYIHYYNHTRIKSRLKISPVLYRKRFEQAA